MQMGTDFEIRRGTDQKRKTKSLRKKIIRLHIRKNYFKLHLLSSMKTRIIRFRIEFSGIYRFDIALGRVKQN